MATATATGPEMGFHCGSFAAGLGHMLDEARTGERRRRSGLSLARRLGLGRARTVSLLRRLFGGGGSSSRQNFETVTTFFTDTRDDAVVQVVGEFYRQRNLAEARPPSPDDLPPGLPAPPSGRYKAMLLREPTNQYDSNAVMVLLWAGGSRPETAGKVKTA